MRLRLAATALTLACLLAACDTGHVASGAPPPAAGEWTAMRLPGGCAAGPSSLPRSRCVALRIAGHGRW